jgi:hypothetical protein
MTRPNHRTFWCANVTALFVLWASSTICLWRFAAIHWALKLLATAAALVFFAGLQHWFLCKPVGKIVEWIWGKEDMIPPDSDTTRRGEEVRRDLRE